MASNNINFRRSVWRSAIFIAILLLFFLFSSIILLLGNIPWHFTRNTNPEFWAIFIGSIAAIENAILLFITLMSQNQGLENEKNAHRQERFETTFFNLLNNHRRLTDGMVVNTQQLNNQLQTMIIPISGRRFFTFANQEMKHINDSIRESYYVGQFCSDLDAQSIEAIIMKYEQKAPENILNAEMQEELDKNYQYMRIKFTNLAYHITNEIWNKHHQEIPNKGSSFLLFDKSYHIYYEHYIRSLSQLLKYVLNEYPKESKKIKEYTDIINAQMSSDELSFIKTLASADTNFHPIIQQLKSKTKQL